MKRKELEKISEKLTLEMKKFAKKNGIEFSISDYGLIIYPDNYQLSDEKEWHWSCHGEKVKL